MMPSEVSAGRTAAPGSARRLAYFAQKSLCQLAAYAFSYEDMATKKDSCQAEVGSLTEQLKQANEKLAEITKSLDRTTRQLKDKKAECVALFREKEAVVSEKDRLSEERSRLAKEKCELLEERRGLADKLLKAEAKIKELEAALTAAAEAEAARMAEAMAAKALEFENFKEGLKPAISDMKAKLRLDAFEEVHVVLSKLAPEAIDKAAVRQALDEEEEEGDEEVEIVAEGERNGEPDAAAVETEKRGADNDA